jgi:hypothetical protein
MGAVPKAFDNRIRTRSPPIVGRTTMRIVWFSNTGVGGSPGNGSGAWMAVLQELTHLQLPFFVSALEERLRNTSTATRIVTFLNLLKAVRPLAAPNLKLESKMDREKE